MEGLVSISSYASDTVVPANGPRFLSTSDPTFTLTTRISASRPDGTWQHRKCRTPGRSAHRPRGLVLLEVRSSRICLPADALPSLVHHSPDTGRCTLENITGHPGNPCRNTGLPAGEHFLHYGAYISRSVRRKGFLHVAESRCMVVTLVRNAIQCVKVQASKASAESRFIQVAIQVA